MQWEIVRQALDILDDARDDGVHGNDDRDDERQAVGGDKQGVEVGDDDDKNDGMRGDAVQGGDEMLGAKDEVHGVDSADDDVEVVQDEVKDDDKDEMHDDNNSIPCGSRVRPTLTVISLIYA